MKKPTIARRLASKTRAGLLVRVLVDASQLFGVEDAVGLRVRGFSKGGQGPSGTGTDERSLLEG
jgi:hypothetical protein